MYTMTLEEQNFENLVNIYRKQIVQLCRGENAHLAYKALKNLVECGVIVKHRVPVTTYFTLSEETMRLLGRKEQPHRMVKW